MSSGETIETAPEDGQDDPRPSVSIKSLTFSDGTTLDVAPGSVVVLVGPNNVGKTVALRDIVAKIEARTNTGRVVTAVDTAVNCPPEVLARWLVRRCSTTVSSGQRIHRAMGQAIAEREALTYWQRHADGLRNLYPLFVCRLTTEERLGAAGPAPRIRLGREPLAHPIHFLERDDRTEAWFSELFRAAFGEDLVLHRNAGSESPLLCGTRPVPENEKGEDRLSFEYQNRLEKLPPLHEQGDGMRAFVGVLLHSLVWGHSVVLIDEPEAFLHPPQARMIGRLLATSVPSDRQLVLATHSGDLLRGLLEAGSDRVKVVRITRQGQINPIRHLDSETLRRLWRDPILRHSSILDGLFYRQVVVCESDADCRFYAALLDSLQTASGERYGHQVMFAHCGGKDRMPVVAGALAVLGVPLTVIADFDVLRSDQPLRATWEALGGSWADIESDWIAVSSSISRKKPDLSVGDVRKEVDSLLGAVTEASLPEQVADRVRRVLRQSSPWEQAKTVGVKYVPSGEPTARCRRLLKALNSRGLFPNEEGELESFVKTVGSHGPKWVLRVLETKDLLSDPELGSARCFLQAATGWQKLEPKGTA